MKVRSGSSLQASHRAASDRDRERPLMFAYWGTGGGLPKFTLDLARVAVAQRSIGCTFSLSTANELLELHSFLGSDLMDVETFRGKWRSVLSWKSLADLRSRLRERFRRDHTQSFVSLMPHVWSPLIAPIIREAGIRYITITHDADPHPGDRYGLANTWLLREAMMADHVVTLSSFVAQSLTATRGIPQSKVSVLFHPDLDYRAPGDVQGNEHDPLRLLFMGRLLPYKGLALLVEAVERLRRQGVAVRVGVYGRGAIGRALMQRLAALEAQVVNRWLSHGEVAHVLSRHDLVAATHTEASQSGIIAAAFGAGLPVIATPVGGIVEQVIPGVTGILAAEVTAPAVAESIRQVAEDRALLVRLREGVAATRTDRSMERFFAQICAIAHVGHW